MTHASHASKNNMPAKLVWYNVQSQELIAPNDADLEQQVTAVSVQALLRWIL